MILPNRPPPALGVVDTSSDGAERIASVARHVLSVVRHRGLSRAEQVQALLWVAAVIAADVPDAQRAAAQAFFCRDAGLRWHLATAPVDDLAALPVAGRA